MTIKLAVMRSGEQVISDIKELATENKICGYLLKEPHVVELTTPIVLLEEGETGSTSNIEISLSPWIVLSEDKEIAISPDTIQAIVEPISTLKTIYEEKVNGTDNQVSLTEE
jgi:hypothetical protein